MQEYTCGRKPAEEFIESLDTETQDKFIIKQQLVQDFGHNYGILIQITLETGSLS